MKKQYYEDPSSCSEEDPLLSTSHRSPSLDDSSHGFIKEEITLEHNELGFSHSNNESQEMTSTSCVVTTQDDNMAFYVSTLPMIKNFTTEQKIQYRIDIMNLIQKYNNHK